MYTATPAAAAQAPRIDTVAIRGHTYFLADDLLEGRATGRRGADVAARYLAAAAERMGLRPAGHSWFQEVPLVEADVDTARTVLVLSQEGAVTWRSPAGFIPNAGTARTLVPFSGGLAWVRSASAILANPSQLPPLAGRVAVMDGVFGAEGAAADTLRSRGAAGVIQLIGDPRLYQLYVASRGESRMYHADPRVVSSFVPAIPAVIAHPDLARALLRGLAAADLQQPRELGGSVDVTVAVNPRPVPARNVAAVLTGSDPALRDQYVVYTAHYDHLGISTPDERGDSLYNGFSDNAAGSAMLLAIAQSLARRPPPRSVLFLWLTGEERGLLGSDWFVANPLVPLERITGVINLDAGAPPAPSVAWRIAGGTESSLGALAVDVARRAGWEATLVPPSPNSDYFPFLRHGVPSVFLVPAPEPFEGMTAEESNDLRRRWDRYHQAGDHWAADYPFSGLARYAEYALLLGRELAERTTP